MVREGDVKVDSTPKNIRQMGESEERIKAYMEDYVNTYLKKLQEERENTEEPEKSGAIGVLVGHMEKAGEVPRVFINGAIELHPTKTEAGIPDFTKEVWTEAYDLQQQYFPGQDLCGIFACEGLCRRFSKQMLFQVVRDNFGDCDQAMLYLLTDEGEEFFYRILGKRQERLSGYYCYYERNEAMQDYMMDHLRPRSVERESVPLRQRPEPETADPVNHYREHMRKAQEGQPQTGGNGRAVYALCAAMVCVVFLSGVFLMKQRQDGILVSDLLRRLHIYQEEDAAEVNAAVEENLNAGAAEYERIISTANGIIVEEIPGNIGTAETMSGEEGEQSEAAPKGEASSETGGGEETGAGNETDVGEETGTGEEAGSGEESSAAEGTGSGEGSGRGEENGSETDPGDSAGSGEEEPQSEVSVQPETEPETEQASEAAAADSSAVQVTAMTGIVYVVQTGDSLSSISRRFYGTDAFVRTIQELNQLSDADMIQAGQVLVLP